MFDPPYEFPAPGRRRQAPALPKIAVEEHFNCLPAAVAAGGSVDVHSIVRAMGYEDSWMALVSGRLHELDEARLAGMDASGIRVALLSHTTPGVQGIVDVATAVAAARDVNDFLAAAIARHPDRYAGLASVALQDPAAAATELERAVLETASPWLIAMLTSRYAFGTVTRLAPEAALRTSSTPITAFFSYLLRISSILSAA